MGGNEWDALTTEAGRGMLSHQNGMPWCSVAQVEDMLLAVGEQAGCENIYSALYMDKEVTELLKAVILNGTWFKCFPACPFNTSNDLKCQCSVGEHWGAGA